MRSDYGTAFLFFTYIIFTIIIFTIIFYIYHYFSAYFKNIGTKQLNRRI